MPNRPPDQDRNLRAIWLAILLLAGALVAMIAGILFHLGGGGFRETITAAAGAFAGVVTLGLAMWHVLTD